MSEQETDVALAASYKKALAQLVYWIENDPTSLGALYATNYAKELLNATAHARLAPRVPPSEG